MSDDLIGRLKGLNLTEDQIDAALDYALRERPVDDGLEAEALSELPVPKVEDYPQAGLDDLLAAVGELGTKEQRLFFDAVIANHYGVKIYEQDDKLIPYDPFQSEIQNRVNLNQILSAKIESYCKLNPYHRSYRKNLEVLAKLGTLDENDTRIYLSSLKRVNSSLGKSSLQNFSSYFESKYEVRGLTFVGLTIAGVISGSITGTTTTIGMLVNLLPLSASFFYWGIANGNKKSTPKMITKYNHALKKHADESKSLDLDLETSLLYAQRLREQVRFPRGIKREYQKRIPELPVKLKEADIYLTGSINLFKKLKQ